MFGPGWMAPAGATGTRWWSTRGGGTQSYCDLVIELNKFDLLVNVSPEHSNWRAGLAELVQLT